MDRITIKEELKVPGTNVVLEKGDVITVIPKHTNEKVNGRLTIKELYEYAKRNHAENYVMSFNDDDKGKTFYVTDIDGVYDDYGSVLLMLDNGTRYGS